MAKDLRSAYSTVIGDRFPKSMEISFVDEGGSRQTLVYEKVQWEIDGERLGLRYGENPDQEAALYKPVNGHLVLGGVESILPGRWLASDPELIKSGKHPGKINVTDADSALGILRYFAVTPTCVIVKHNNPSGVAKAATLPEAYHRAYMADRVAAFGGLVAVNRPLDKTTAEMVAEHYMEVVVAPDFEEGALAVFEKKKNVRVMRIRNMERLSDFAATRFLEFKSLIDGGQIVQWSFQARHFRKEDFLPAESNYQNKLFRVTREPSGAQWDDMIFGWLVETGITSNSVIYVKDGVTVGIGTGEQDRVGVAEIARDKAYRKLSDRYAFELFGKPWNLLTDPDARRSIEERVAAEKGGLLGSVMISDAFFPFRDGVEVGLREGVGAVVQPGGSLRDFESIEACNEYGAAMVFTGQRCFRH